uniref:Apolipoprotein D n=1 Tax=Timema tahoe TaxID=61484 RepID=A0A7R9FI74_9NEOP|nr:unnamed protein product [Timema tahoe]
MAGGSLVNILLFVIVVSSHSMAGKRREDKKKCPHVKGVKNFDLNEILGKWYVVQYYASSEEALSYRCMREVFTMAADRPEVSMNFTYIFTDDPEGEKLVGNITWRIPNGNRPAHWVHAEDSCEYITWTGQAFIYPLTPLQLLPHSNVSAKNLERNPPSSQCCQIELVSSGWLSDLGGKNGVSGTQHKTGWKGIDLLQFRVRRLLDIGGGLLFRGPPCNEGVYNTYVLDWEPKSWALLLHCAEKSGSPRYLSSFIMSRRPDVAPNVVSYLREKLPRYDIDLDYMFPMSQENCSGGGGRPGFDPRILTNVKHPMKVSH